MKAFPLFLTVQARSLVVFGGGEEAAAKLRLLLKTEANVIAVASAFEPAVSELEGLTLIRQNPLCCSAPTTPRSSCAFSPTSRAKRCFRRPTAAVMTSTR